MTDHNGVAPQLVAFFGDELQKIVKISQGGTQDKEGVTGILMLYPSHFA